MSTAWSEYYKSHVVSREEAIGQISPGDHVVYAHAAAQPGYLHDALIAHAGELKDVEISYGFALGKQDFCEPEYQDSFHLNSVFLSAANRQAMWEGRADFTSIHMSQLDRYYKAHGVDVLLTQVTPPDENGNVSMGVSVDYCRNIVDHAKIVIAQVNNNMPWTYGESVIPVEKIDFFVEYDEPIAEIPETTKVTDNDRAIANYIASLIHDGDTIQTGVGAVPDTVLSLLGNHKDIGIHTELACTGVMRMIEKGVITNAKKSVDKGKVVATLMGGTKEFYDYVSHNPMFEMRKCSYVNNPLVIAQQKNICAMNSALQIDLMGQVCAEMMGPKQFSGVGGQLDFLRGAAMAEGGRSIICMPSTAAKGTVSRIVPMLTPGACVTDTRYDVMYIVTEYGIADLWGKTNKERAEALISIAHPNFREQLERDFYEKMYKIM